MPMPVHLPTYLIPTTFNRIKYYLHTYLPTYLPTYIPTTPTHRPTYLPTYIPTTPTHRSTYLPATPTHRPTYLHTCTYLPTTPVHPPTYLILTTFNRIKYCPACLAAFFLSLNTGSIGAKHYARECWFWNFKKKKNLMAVLFTKFGVP